jgi:hypothetical protein
MAKTATEAAVKRGARVGGEPLLLEAREERVKRLGQGRVGHARESIIRAI